LHGAIEIVGQSILEAFAPGGRAWRQTADGKANRRNVEARVNAAAAVEADLLRIQFVKIVEQTADRKPLVIVEGLLENGVGDAAAVEHEIFANDAAGIG